MTEQHAPYGVSTKPVVCTWYGPPSLCSCHKALPNVTAERDAYRAALLPFVRGNTWVAPGSDVTLVEVTEAAIERARALVGGEVLRE